MSQRDYVDPNLNNLPATLLLRELSARGRFISWMLERDVVALVCSQCVSTSPEQVCSAIRYLRYRRELIGTHFEEAANPRIRTYTDDGYHNYIMSVVARPSSDIPRNPWELRAARYNEYLYRLDTYINRPDTLFTSAEFRDGVTANDQKRAARFLKDMTSWGILKRFSRGGGTKYSFCEGARDKLIQRRLRPP